MLQDQMEWDEITFEMEKQNDICIELSDASSLSIHNLVVF